MYLNYICQVDRLNSDADGNRSYVLSVLDTGCISSWDNEQEWGRQLAGARHHVQIESHPKSLDSIANLRDDLSGLMESKLFDEERGGVRLWLPSGLLGALHVTILAGKGGLGELATLADMGLESEHLYLQFSVNAGFSLHADNPLLPMPVTFEMFCAGTRLYLPGLPDVGLVRKHVP